MKDKISFGPEVAPDTRIVTRKRGEETEVALLRPAKDGDPIQDGEEYVVIEKECQDGWHDAETIYSTRSGPAQVATPKYRDGYDRIFGGKQKVGVA